MKINTVSDEVRKVLSDDIAGGETAVFETIMKMAAAAKNRGSPTINSIASKQKKKKTEGPLNWVVFTIISTF